MIKWGDMYCPVCEKMVHPVRHVYSDKVEYRCPHCGHLLEVVHFEKKKKEVWNDVRRC